MKVHKIYNKIRYLVSKISIFFVFDTALFKIVKNGNIYRKLIFYAKHHPFIGLGCIMKAARGAGLFALEESILKLIIIINSIQHWKFGTFGRSTLAKAQIRIKTRVQVRGRGMSTGETGSTCALGDVTQACVTLCPAFL